MVSALSSLLLGRPVRPEVGMTGEVTLQGRVLLPIRADRSPRGGDDGRPG
jgi:hypothetical protein